MVLTLKWPKSGSFKIPNYCICGPNLRKLAIELNDLSAMHILIGISKFLKTLTGNYPCRKLTKCTQRGRSKLKKMESGE